MTISAILQSKGNEVLTVECATPVREADGAVATVAIEAMEFIAPILLHDLISVYARVERIGRTSIAIRIEVVASRDRGREEVKVTEGLFTFVALDENHQPRPVKR